MVHGEVATIAPSELPKGSVITTSGRISGVTEPGELSVQLAHLELDGWIASRGGTWCRVTPPDG